MYIYKYKYIYTYIYIYIYIYIYPEALIQARFSIAVFPQRFSIFIVYLVHCLHEVSRGWIAKEKFLKFRSPDCQKMSFQHSF